MKVLLSNIEYTTFKNRLGFVKLSLPVSIYTLNGTFLNMIFMLLLLFFLENEFYL